MRAAEELLAALFVAAIWGPAGWLAAALPDGLLLRLLAAAGIAYLVVEAGDAAFAVHDWWRRRWS